MGTRFELLLVGPDPEHLRAVAEEALDEIERIDRAWSVFRLDSELSQVNRSAVREPIRISQELMDLLLRAEELRDLTQGAFDAAVGGFTHSGEDPKAIPPLLGVSAALAGEFTLDPVRISVCIPYA